MEKGLRQEGRNTWIRLIKITTWWRKYSIIRKSVLIIAFLFVKQNSQSLRCLKIRLCLLLSWKQRNDFITMLSSLQTEKILVIITTTLHSLAFNWRSWFKTKLTTCRVERIWVLSADHCHQQHVSHLKNIWWCSLQKIFQICWHVLLFRCRDSFTEGRNFSVLSYKSNQLKLKAFKSK